MRILVSLAAAAALSGCASSHVLVGNARPRISPDEVRIYLSPPAEYEEIALLSAADTGAFPSQQGRMNKIMKRLRKEAAKLGANGILLSGVSSEVVGSLNNGTAIAMGTTAYGTGVSTAVVQKTGTGIAIYVKTP
jgi:type IV pilus biogenesis protein CpaD/CtpE